MPRHYAGKVKFPGSRAQTSTSTTYQRYITSSLSFFHSAVPTTPSLRLASYLTRCNGMFALLVFISTPSFPVSTTRGAACVLSSAPVLTHM